jgi:hypothetical protein
MVGINGFVTINIVPVFMLYLRYCLTDRVDRHLAERKGWSPALKQPDPVSVGVIV